MSRLALPSLSRSRLLAAALVAVLVVIVLDLAESRHPTPKAAPTEQAAEVTEPQPAPSPSPATRDPILGVFRGGGWPSDLDEFGTWLGRKPKYALTFGEGTTWTTIANPSGLDRWDSAPYRFVYSVPLLPEDRSATIRTGATGAYNGYFTQLARNLVAHGQGDAILRLGWEFNIKNSRWATKDTAAFKKYWRQVVRSMRAVPGSDFEFDWNPVNAHTTYDGSLYYPGAQYVDYIGIDVYDVSWIPDTYPWPDDCTAACIRMRREATWEYLENDERGLVFWSHFAQAKGKPLSLPEWGMWTRPDGRGGGDNPLFIRNMHAFITEPRNNVAYQLYFDYDAPDGEHELVGTFPKGGALYRKLFGPG